LPDTLSRGAVLDSERRPGQRVQPHEGTHEITHGEPRLNTSGRVVTAAGQRAGDSRVSSEARGDRRAVTLDRRLDADGALPFSRVSRASQISPMPLGSTTLRISCEPRRAPTSSAIGADYRGKARRLDGHLPDRVNDVPGRDAEAIEELLGFSATRNSADCQSVDREALVSDRSRNGIPYPARGIVVFDRDEAASGFACAAHQ